jgi:hypothetical protein
MSFSITGLDPASFRRFYGLSDEELQSLGVRRFIADAKPGFPDRIELRDVEQGEALLLLNYLHQPAETPYNPCHLRPRMGRDAVSRRGRDAGGLMDPPDLASCL